MYLKKILNHTKRPQYFAPAGLIPKHCHQHSPNLVILCNNSATDINKEGTAPTTTCSLRSDSSVTYRDKCWIPANTWKSPCAGHSAPTQLLLKFTSHTGHDLPPKMLLLVKSIGKQKTCIRFFPPCALLGRQTFLQSNLSNEASRASTAEDPER